MKWAAAAAVVAVCTVLPLVVPVEWVSHGPFPDLAVVVVAYLGMRGSPDRAALLGVTLGFVSCPFTAEPFAQQAFLLGAFGYGVGHLSRVVFRHKWAIQMGATGLGAALLRVLSASMAEWSLEGAVARTGATAWPVSGPVSLDATEMAEHVVAMAGFAAGPLAGAALLAGLASAVAAPPVFALLGASHALRAVEPRSWTGV